MTPNVTSLWFRAPEILLGANFYSAAIDMWAVGCVVSELLLFQPLFSGKNDIQQLDQIFDTLGCPNSRIWPELETLPLIKDGSVDLVRARRRNEYNNLRLLLPTISDEGFEFINRLLAYSPARRYSVSQAVHHAYFTVPPLPTQLSLMPTFPSTQSNMLVDIIPGSQLPTMISLDEVRGLDQQRRSKHASENKIHKHHSHRSKKHRHHNKGHKHL
jgi:cell division cycle 2-like protein